MSNSGRRVNAGRLVHFVREVRAAIDAVPDTRERDSAHLPTPRFFEVESAQAQFGVVISAGGLVVTAVSAALLGYGLVFNPHVHIPNENGVTPLQASCRAIAFGLVVAALGLLLLWRLVLRMRRSPDAEMLAWLAAYSSQFNVPITKPPATRAEFAAYVSAGYERRDANANDGALAELSPYE